MSSSKLAFETFIVSPEPTKSPETLRIVQTAKSITKKMQNRDIHKTSFSAKFLDRFVITCEGTNLRSLSGGDFVEVMDFDPSRRVAVVIGRGIPSMDTPLHWMAYKIDPTANYVAFVRLAEEGQLGSENILDPDNQVRKPRLTSEQRKLANDAGMGYAENIVDVSSLLAAAREMKGKNGLVTSEGILVWNRALEPIEEQCRARLMESSNSF